MKKLTIIENDQTIQPEINLGDFTPPNDFIESLVAEATREGSATMEGPEGCPVTANVWESEDE